MDTDKWHGDMHTFAAAPTPKPTPSTKPYQAIPSPPVGLGRSFAPPTSGPVPRPAPASIPGPWQPPGRIVEKRHHALVADALTLSPTKFLHISSPCEFDESY